MTSLRVFRIDSEQIGRADLESKSDTDMQNVCMKRKQQRCVHAVKFICVAVSLFYSALCIPAQNSSLDSLLNFVIQRAFGQHADRLSVLVLVKDDIAVIFDEAALGERAVESTEGVLLKKR